MTRRFLRAMSSVLPPRSWLLGAVVLVIGSYFGEWALMALLSWQLDATLELWEGPQGYRGLLLMLLAAYSTWRVATFHPVFRPKYRTWLQTVPWRPGNALPLGPAQIVWQDLVVLAAIATLCGDVQSWLVAPYFLLLPWIFGLTAANLMTSVDAWGYASLLLLAPVMLAKHWPWLALGMLPAYAVAAAGSTRCLKRFPWDQLARWRALWADSSQRNGRTRPNPAWPLLQMPRSGGEVRGVAWATVRWWMALSAVAALALACLAMLEESNSVRECGESLTKIFIIVGIVMSTVRTVVFCAVCWSPISLAGRLRTGRLIIPGYDQVLVAPLLILATGVLLPGMLIDLGAPLPFVAAAVAPLLVVLTFGMGPTLEQWRLTGAYRLIVMPALEGRRASRR